MLMLLAGCNWLLPQPNLMLMTRCDPGMGGTLEFDSDEGWTKTMDVAEACGALVVLGPHEYTSSVRLRWKRPEGTVERSLSMDDDWITAERDGYSVFLGLHQGGLRRESI